MKPCPYCGSPLENAADKCQDCGRWLDPSLDSTRNADSPPIVLPPRSRSGLAIGSLVCAIFALGPGSIAAVILGYLALRQIRRDPLRINGKRMAIAGLILGWLGILGTTVALLLGIYFWKSLDGTSKKPHVRQAHLISTALSSSSSSIQSAALAANSLARIPGAACSCVVISQHDGSASSRLTSCVCRACPALRASTLPSSGNPTSARSPIRSSALCRPNSSA